MKVTPSRIQASRKKMAILGALIVILIALAGWWVFSALTKPEPTFPLGSGFEYIGKTDYGCNGFCASTPNSTYYYATDMNVESIEKYFKKASLYRPSEAETTNIRIWFDSAISDDDFLISYYHNDGSISARPFLDKTDKNVVSIPSFDYPIAKDSL